MSPPPDAQPDALPIGLLLARLQRTEQALLRQTAALWAVTAVGAGGLGALLLAPASARVAELWAVLGLVLATGAGLHFGLWLPRRLAGDLSRTARLVGERLPVLSLGLLGGMELERSLQSPGDFSTPLAQAHLRSLAQRAAQLDLSRVADRAPLQRAQRTLLALLLLTGGALLWGRSRLREGVHALQPATLIAQAGPQEPITGEVELAYRYPAYTGLAPRTVQGSSGEISAPVGTEVTLKARSDRPVARAHLSLGTGASSQSVPLRVEAQRDLSGSLTVQRSTPYRFVFESGGGRVLAVGPDLPIHADPDAVPQVSLLSPAQELEVQADEKVTLKYQAQDDYGLSAVRLRFERKGKTETVKLPEPTADEKKKLGGQYSWNLKTLPLEEGERISYHLEVEDNDALPGPQQGASRVHVLKVYSATEHRRAALARARQLWERMVAHLAERMEGADRQTPRPASSLNAGMQLDQSGYELTRLLMEAGTELRHERDAPPGLAPALNHMGESLRERIAATSEARRLFLLRPLGTDPLPPTAQREIDTLRQNVLYLEALLEQAQTQLLQALARKLTAERRALTSQLEAYRKTKDPALQKALLEQVAALREKMRELVRQMAQLQQGLSDEHLSSDALKDLNMESQLDDLEKLIREGKADEAMAKLQQLDMRMKSMDQQLDRNNQESGSGDPELRAKFQSFQKELEETRKDQEQLAERTRTLRDRYREQRKKDLAARADKLRDQLLKETQALQKDYRAIPPDAAAPPPFPGAFDVQHSVQETSRELENLESALKAQDFDLAAETSHRVRRAAQQAANAAQLRPLSRGFRPDPPAQSPPESGDQGERLEKDAERAEALEKKLSDLFPPMGQMMSEADQKETQKLANGQRQLQQKLQGLQQQMQGLQERAPIFGKDAREQMQQVGEQMGEASQELGGREAARAYGQERAAAEGLQQFADRLKQAQQQSGSGSGGTLPMADQDRGSDGQEGGDSSNRSHQKVEIPDAEDSQAPREFRKDLLEAMKQGTPERYREQVKRYYEELVK